ncbi:MAG: WecB/TagA/CpsF family glycosyltransferase [Bacillota bacterium]|uniref:WecB/TagA/CpsF family glycosyltransferase n=1 Tax=Virgibacillus sp. M23 TaxID=3079030 RepID=UPI002A91584D|nr:WecB/TagA/CpsF family glycosyltransferase [Virgibacillus sp. M23]MDY7044964.1 WecB/TagA/CpsF family glycosyltransferase [Virgibacillus sp. M23]
MSFNNTVTIMGIPFLNTTRNDFLRDYLVPRLDEEQKCFVVTANPEIVMKARENDTYRQIIRTADYIVPDGVGILKAAKFQKQPLQERVTGYDLTLDLLSYANDHGLNCYFLGAKDEINAKAVSEVQRSYPHIQIAGHHHGYIDMEDETFAESIQNSEPDIIFVALGSPKQEQWIMKHKEKFSKGIFIGIGGVFDVLAGKVPRAPKAWINLNLEWLYRLLKQPSRWKRILKAVEFMFRVYVKKD